MTIIPDTKDWTWVLRAPCPECGYDAATVAPEDVSARIEDYAATWQEALGRSTVRDRPAPDVWSPLEYGCHVRDACQIYDERLRLMLTEDGPSYPNWDQDETALAARYGEQEPETVTAELHAAAARWPPASLESPARNGTAPATAATARNLPSIRSPAISCMTSCTTCTTSGGLTHHRLAGDGHVRCRLRTQPIPVLVWSRVSQIVMA